MSGIVNSTDCSVQANSNEGCVVTNPSLQSYGAAFAAAGGGVFVTEFAENGVSVWFFTVRVLLSVLLLEFELFSAVGYSSVVAERHCER